MSIVKGMGTAGYGWRFEKGDMCCEEAEAMTGKTNLCGGSTNTPPPLGVVVRASRTPIVENSRNDNGGGWFGTNTPPPAPSPIQTPPPPARWRLISTTAIPETPSGGYSYSAQASSTHLDVYNGDKHDFQWTKPPQEFDMNGFTVSLSVHCQSQPNNRCASLIGVRGDGLESDTPGGDRKAEAFGENGATGSGQKSVTFKPSASSDEIEVEVGIMWSAVRFVYKYRRV